MDYTDIFVNLAKPKPKRRPDSRPDAHGRPEDMPVDMSSEGHDAMGGGGASFGQQAAGLLASISDAVDSGGPIMTPPPMQFGNPIRDNAIGQSLQGFQYGGRLRQGLGLVGENGPEVIDALPDGGVDITPLDEQRAKSGTFGSIPYGLNQTENGADSTPVPFGLDQPSYTQAQRQPPPQTLNAPADLIQQKLQAIYDAQTKPIKTNKVLGGLALAVQGLDRAVNGGNAPIQTLTDLRRQRAVNKAARGLEPLMQQQQMASQAQTAADTHALRQAQAATIPVDDENRRLQIELQRQTAQDRARGLATSRLTKLKYYDPANAAHQALAIDAGLDPEDLKGWDDRNPLIKKVGDTTYQYNRSTGAFDPTNLPKDESQTLTPYSVKMPTGETRTFRVPQKDAARFATQMQAVGAQINAADTRQQRQLAAEQQRQQITIKAQKELASYNQLLKDASSEKDQKRKLELQNNAAEHQKELVRLRAQYKQLDEQGTEIPPP